MDFRILGPLEVFDSDGPIAVRGARQRGLLELLLLHSNTVVSTEEIIERLWGSSPPENVRNSIQVGISKLRKTLQRSGEREGSAPVLVTHPGGYAIHIEPETLDLTRFDRLSADGRGALARDDFPTAAARFREALVLWRGTPLADFADEPFAHSEAAALEDSRLAALEDRIEADLALGRHGELVHELEGLVARYPLRERFRAELMLALYRSGRQAEALEAYKDARRQLVEQLGIEPGITLQELERAILRQDPTLEAPRLRDLGAPVELPDELGSRAPGFVGRGDELHLLTSAWQAAARGQSRLVFITGEAGVGKTRTAAQLAQLVAHRGAAVLYANCGPQGTYPGRAIVEAIRGGAPAFSDHDRARLAAVEDDDDVVLADLLRTLGQRAPVLLVLDDLQWAAAPTPAFLKTFFSEDRAAAVMIVATCSDSKLDPLHPLAVAQETLRRRRNVDRLYLTGLGDDEVSELAHAVDPACDPGIVEAIQRETGGNPKLILETIRGRVGDGDADATSPPCPYKGLVPFERSDADVYFGREDELESLLRRLCDAGLLAIVGASGSGKTSLLAAGLEAAVSRGAVADTARWHVLRMRPGAQPLADLAARLANLTGVAAGTILAELREGNEALDLAARQVVAGDDRAQLLLVVDQFEELFTVCDDEEARRRFAATLVHAATQHGRRVTVVIAIRADFYGHCAALPAFAEVLTANQVLLGPLDEERLRAVMERPAEQVGLRLEPGLVETILPEVVGRPGVLPLLEHTLLETWHRRHARTLTLSGYRSAGGIRGALAKTADEAYLSLDAGSQQIARAIFTRVTEPREGTEDTGRRVQLDELEAIGEPATVHAIVEQLATARLLTVDEHTCELTHEALIKAWPRLRDWLDDDRESRRILSHVRDSAKAWDALGRDPGELYRGARLDAVLEWRDENRQLLTATEQEFIAAGQEQHDREAAETTQRLRNQVRQNRRLRNALVAAFVLLVAAIAGALVAVVQRNQANDARRLAQSQQKIAEARRLAAQSIELLQDRPDTALLLGVEGVRLDDSVEERGALLSALAARPGLLGYLHAQGGLLDIAVSPDGKTLAEGDEFTPLQYWSLDSSPPREQSIDLNSPGATTFLPDGTVVTAVHDQHLERWNLTTRSRVMQTPVLPNGASIYAVAATPDGKTIAAAGDDGKVRLYDAARGGPPIATFPHPGGTAWSDAFSPDGSLLAVTSDGGPATLYRLADGTSRTLPVNQKGTYGVAFSPDGHTVAVGGADGTLAYWNPRTGRQFGKPVQTVAGTTLLSLAFSPDGRILVASGADGSARVLDARTRIPVQAPFRGHSGSVLSTAISPNGSTLYTGGEDASIGIWSLTGNQALARSLPSPGTTVTSVTFVHSGLAATAGFDRKVRFWQLPGGSESGSPLAVGAGVSAMRASPNGKLLAIGTRRGQVLLYDTARREPLPALERQRLPISSIAFSPDGSRLAASSLAGTVLLWNVASSPVLVRSVPAQTKGTADAIAFSPDSRLLAVGGASGDVEFFDSHSGAPLGKPYAGDRGVHSIAWRPDGKLLAVGVTGGSIRLVSMATREVVGELEGHFQPPSGAAFSPGGDELYSVARDGTLRLWNIATASPIGAPLTTGADRRASLALSPDGKMLLTTAGPQALVWNVDPSTWVARGCKQAGRNLSDREWAQHGPKGAYRIVCPGLPKPAAG